jgi:hypothetical protein
MKHVKLFEAFVNEAKGAPDSIVALVKKMQIGSRVVGKEVTDKRNGHEPWTGKMSEDPWLSILDQKLRGIGFDFEIDPAGAGVLTSRRVYKINDYINMIINRGSSNASIDLEDALTTNTIKKQEYYGNDEATTDAVAAVISANLDIFNQLKGAGSENTSMSIRKLNSDKLAGTIEKRLKGIYVSGGEAESIAYGILLRALDGLDSVERAEGIQNIINTLNSYLKDKDYMDISN